MLELYTGPYSPCPNLPKESTLPNGDDTICGAGIRTANIGPSGDVRACTVLPFVVGNVAHRDFRSVWETSPWLHHLRSLRVRDLKGCADCHRLAYCNRCPAQALAETGDLLGVSPSACALAEVIERAHGREP